MRSINGLVEDDVRQKHCFSAGLRVGKLDIYYRLTGMDGPSDTYASSQTCERRKTSVRPLVVVWGQPGKVKENRNERFGYGLGSQQHNEREREDGEDVGDNNEDRRELPVAPIPIAKDGCDHTRRHCRLEEQDIGLNSREVD